VELEQDIKMYLSLEKSPINIEFWEVTFFAHVPFQADPSVGNDGNLPTSSRITARLGAHRRRSTV